MKTIVGSGNSEAINAGIPFDVLEELCRLNLSAHFPNVVDFFDASWKIGCSLMGHISSLKLSILTPRQKVSIFTIGKSLRLMRSIHKLAFSGMWPEAQIILRTQLEAKVQLMYILDEKGDARAQKWMSIEDPKQYWRFHEMTKGPLELFRKQYETLSLYLHSHVQSLIGYVGSSDETSFHIEVGPLGNEQSLKIASEILGNTAMMNDAVCEISRYEFTRFPEWEEEHEKLMAMKYFQDQQPKVKEMLDSSKGKDFIEKVIGSRQENETGGSVPTSSIHPST